MRAALVGTIVQPGQRAIPVFDKHAMLDAPDVMRYLEREIFAPWDAFCRAAREFAIEYATTLMVDADPARVMAFERRVFYTLDAVVECVADVGQARGLKDGTRRQDLYLLRGAIGPIDTFLRAWGLRWRRTRRDPIDGDRWEPIADRAPEEPTPRDRAPSARRGR